MAYELVFPPDTRIDIEEFVTSRCLSKIEALAAVAEIEAEAAKIAANPRIGASPPHGPFEWRRIYRFLVRTSVNPRTEVEFAYAIREKSGSVVLSGFSEVEAP